MATLTKFFETSGTSQRSLAEKLGISKGHMSDLASGRRTPSLSLALRIVKATGGAVSADELGAVHAKKRGKPAATVQEVVSK